MAIGVGVVYLAVLLLSLCVCGWVAAPSSQLCRSMQNAEYLPDETVPPCSSPQCSLLECPQGPPVHKRTHPAAPSRQQPSSSQPPVSYQTQLAQQWRYQWKWMQARARSG